MRSQNPVIRELWLAITQLNGMHVDDPIFALWFSCAYPLLRFFIMSTVHMYTFNVGDRVYLKVIMTAPLAGLAYSSSATFQCPAQ